MAEVAVLPEKGDDRISVINGRAGRTISRRQQGEARQGTSNNCQAQKLTIHLALTGSRGNQKMFLFTFCRVDSFTDCGDKVRVGIESGLPIGNLSGSIKNQGSWNRIDPKK